MHFQKIVKVNEILFSLCETLLTSAYNAFNEAAENRILPNPEDGVTFITQKPILPGKSYFYNFEIMREGTYGLFTFITSIIYGQGCSLFCSMKGMKALIVLITKF